MIYCWKLLSNQKAGNAILETPYLKISQEGIPPDPLEVRPCGTRHVPPPPSPYPYNFHPAMAPTKQAACA